MLPIVYNKRKRAYALGTPERFSALASSSSLCVFSTLPHTNSLNCPLITFSFSRTIFSDMVCYLLSNGVSRLHSTRDLQTMSFLAFFQFAKFL